MQEIIINLIGAESFALLLLDEKTKQLQTIAWGGVEEMPGVDHISTRVGDGILGEVAKSGISYYINHELDGRPITLEAPLAAIPLKIKEHVIGLIVIWALLAACALPIRQTYINGLIPSTEPEKSAKIVGSKPPNHTGTHAWAAAGATSA